MPFLEVIHLFQSVGCVRNKLQFHSSTESEIISLDAGLTKLVTDLIGKEYDDHEQETSETKTEVCAFASRSKSKAKPRKTFKLLAHLQGLYQLLKGHGLVLTQELNPIKRIQWQKDWTLFFGMDKYLEKKMVRSNSGDWKKIFGTNFEHSQYWSDEMWKSTMTGSGNNKKRFQYCTDSSHWSYTSGQCLGSGQFLRVHLSHWMCSQLTLHHKFRIDSGETKFKQRKTDNIFYGCESHGQGSQRSARAWLDHRTSCTVQAENVSKTPRHGVLGRYTACSTKRFEDLSKQEEMQSPFTMHSQLIISRKLFVVESEEIKEQKVYMSPRHPPKISSKDNGMKELASEVVGGDEDSKQTQPLVNAPSLSQSCVPVSVECVDKDKDADENVDADHVRTGRLVYEQPPGLFTQREDTDIDELFKPICNKNDAYNPFSVVPKVMICDMGNEKLFELCETLPKVQCSECLLFWNQGIVFCTCGHLLKESEASHQTNNYRQYCHVCNTAQHCRLGLLQDSDFAGDFEDSKSTSGCNLMYLWTSYSCSDKLDV